MRQIRVYQLPCRRGWREQFINNPEENSHALECLSPLLPPKDKKLPTSITPTGERPASRLGCWQPEHNLEGILLYGGYCVQNALFSTAAFPNGSRQELLSLSTLCREQRAATGLLLPKNGMLTSFQLSFCRLLSHHRTQRAFQLSCLCIIEVQYNITA